CQMNKSDSERIATVLEKIGYSPTSKIEMADLIVLNVCSVRQSAVDRVYGKIDQILKIKNQNKKLKPKIILTGCILSEDKEKLKNKVDFILEINNLPKWPELISKSKPEIKTKNYLEIKPQYSSFPIAYVPIMTGCNNFCSYCVVPYTRGREISRPVEKIICEVKKLIKEGYKMIVLLGQNVNSYQKKIKIQKSKVKTINFYQLLKMINDLKGDFWLTFITSHPKDLSDKLIETMAKCKKVMPYLHLPVQSGDDEILKRMNRHYTVSHYKNLIRKIRKKFFQTRQGIERYITISTDIIVGFPTETKKQFTNTAKLMREIKFDMAYIAKYSPRFGTAAAKLKDDVSIKEKERRWRSLVKILEKTALEKNKRYLNKVVDVLIENKKENFLFGRTKTFKNVKIPVYKSDNENLKGKFIKVKIKKITPWGLESFPI
ncbi:MAG: tRNA (N6-isopentenyl adenosine(37)-C2)-methylthiotransferase MiaB, partial [Patescibacteria group bacterium]